VTVSNDERLLTLSNGSLAIVDVLTSDTGNYTCRAENKHGADEIVISLVIQGIDAFLQVLHEIILHRFSVIYIHTLSRLCYAS